MASNDEMIAELVSATMKVRRLSKPFVPKLLLCESFVNSSGVWYFGVEGGRRSLQCWQKSLAKIPVAHLRR